MGSHVVLDLADLGRLETASYGLMLGDLPYGRWARNLVAVLFRAGFPRMSNGN